jgi:hypothetical protein
MLVFRCASDFSCDVSGNSVADGFAFDCGVFCHKSLVLVKVSGKCVAVVFKSLNEMVLMLDGLMFPMLIPL